MIAATATGPSPTHTPPPGESVVTIESSSWATNVTPLQFLPAGGSTWFDVDELNTPGTALSITKNRVLVVPGGVTYRLNPSAWSANIIARFSEI